jgi:hypothetical protein
MRQQAIGFFLHYFVAFAAAAFEPAAVDNRDEAAGILDDAALLELAGGLRDPLPAHAQHGGNEFLRHLNLVFGQAVEAVQQPATELLLDGVMQIADRRLLHLRDQGMGEFKHEQLEHAALGEFSLQFL